MDHNRISKNHLSFEYFLALKFKNNNLINLIIQMIQVQQLECNHSDQNTSKKIHPRDLKRLWPSFPKDKKKEANEEINIMKGKNNNNSYIKNHRGLQINLWEFEAQAYDLYFKEE
jgi:hypothetical protein